MADKSTEREAIPSSATALANGPASQHPSSKKRKRPGTVVVPVRSSVLSKDLRSQLSLVESLLQAARLIAGGADTLGGGTADEKATFTQEHMKSVIRSDPITAARVSGRLLEILSIGKPLASEGSVTHTHMDPDLSIQIWNSRSQPNDDIGGASSNVRSTPHAS